MPAKNCAQYSLKRPYLTLIHWLSTIAFVLSLLTGLRLFVANRLTSGGVPSWTQGLPAGDIFGAHAAVVWLWLVVVIVYCAGSTGARSRLAIPPGAGKAGGKAVPRRRLHGFNRRVIQAGRIAMPMALLSGVFLWSGWLSSARSMLLDLHLMFAAAAVTLIGMHVGAQWASVSFAGFKNLFLRMALRRYRARPLAWISLIAVGLLWVNRASLEAMIATDLPVQEIRMADDIEIDGLLVEPAWSEATAVTVMTRLPGGSENIPVDVRAMRKGLVIYFAFSWPDPTKSLQHLPLIKTAQGWRVQQDGYASHDERTWYEDKFAVAFGQSPKLAGDGSIHLGVGDGSNLQSVRGLHYTLAGIVDLWHWKAVRNHEFAVLDDSHFSEAYAEVAGSQRYTAGYFADPSYTKSIANNWMWFNNDYIVPKRLPKDPAQLSAFQVARGSNIPWLLAWHDTEPYDPDDDNYPENTWMPSVLWIDSPDTDRADVAARGTWRNGRWTLEAVRALAAESEFDLDIADGTFVWVAAFDHAQSHHTYHLRPLRLTFE